MNPDHLWLTDAMQFLSFFAIGPAIAIAITWRTWRGKPQNLNLRRFGVLCLMSGVTGSLLFGLAKWINADVRTAQYFLQLARVLLSALLFGVFMGCGWSLLLRLWQWHQATRLAQSGRVDDLDIPNS
jgi:hypothetical protein